ncbi:MAG UNVERIFIED_CONTAM: hypothetical protein LVR29_00065 [Microcystis novacekii LVE1205-3]
MTELILLTKKLAIFPLYLAVGAVHHHLIRSHLRLKASIVIDMAQCWSTHHFACLIGYGASAVCPYLALATICPVVDRAKNPEIDGKRQIRSY